MLFQYKNVKNPYLKINIKYLMLLSVNKLLLVLGSTTCLRSVIAPSIGELEVVSREKESDECGSVYIVCGLVACSQTK